MARSFAERMIGAAMLNPDVYEEVEADESATAQAAGVVALAAVAGAIGAYRSGAVGMVGAIVGAFVSWALWAGVTYIVGTRLFNGTATWGELLRTLGFAQAPGLLAVVGFIPILGGLVKFVVWIWVLIAGIVAIRQALDFDTGKAILTAIISFIVVVVVTMMLGILTGGMAALGGAFAH
ncbi:MAG TPA: YIP1 family protein [Longimicrobiaceae bacterium]|nr:YIP1 family protein [Longimicrobiaceae bacterium]